MTTITKNKAIKTVDATRIICGIRQIIRLHGVHLKLKSLIGLWQ